MRSSETRAGRAQALTLWRAFRVLCAAPACRVLWSCSTICQTRRATWTSTRSRRSHFWLTVSNVPRSPIRYSIGSACWLNGEPKSPPPRYHGIRAPYPGGSGSGRLSRHAAASHPRRPGVDLGMSGSIGQKHRVSVTRNGDTVVTEFLNIGECGRMPEWCPWPEFEPALLAELDFEFERVYQFRHRGLRSRAERAGAAKRAEYSGRRFRVNPRGCDCGVSRHSGAAG